ncbi:MAG: hypothetical protein KI788_03435 [Mameliella sp.]|nr:hypothetical protein [Mameliella sp.]
MSPRATEDKFRDALQDWPEDRVAAFLQVLREVDSRPDALAEISRLMVRQSAMRDLRRTPGLL